jgi:opacity protein-like surface antigen
MQSSVLVCGVLVCAAAAAQSFEASVSGGESYIPSKSSNLGTYSPDPNSGTYFLRDGFRLTFRMTLNSWRFMGHEFGYAYNHTSLDQPPIPITTGGISLPGLVSPATNIGTPAHQGFYDFMFYATPEGSRVRPFACGGVQFTAFSTPGSSYYGNRETKYGINYGAGLKVKVKDPWGMRLDVRQYNMGKPFSLPNATGRLLLWEIGVGISFLL